MDDINFIKNRKEDQKKWWLEAESNHRHGDFQSPALPTELSSHFRVKMRLQLYTVSLKTSLKKRVTLERIASLFIRGELIQACRGRREQSHLVGL